MLREVVNGAWRKENELKELKSELAALDRKIQLSLKPIEGGGTLSNGQSEPEKKLPKELQDIKEAMGDRLIIASPAKGGVKM